MMMKKIIKIAGVITGIALLLIALLVVAGYWFVGGEPGTEDTQTEDIQSGIDGLFLIMEHDTVEEKLVLYSYDEGEESTYQYSFSTAFFDKYGKNEPVVRFTAGRVVSGLKTDKDGVLTEICLSDEVWEMKDVKRFSVDVEKGVFRIASTNYSVREEVFVFSNEKRIGLAELTENDILRIVGIGNKILSVDVTTGHGTLALSNTELFEGSLLKLNDNFYVNITPEMSLEVQEGTYQLTVANDGWGGSREIIIKRGETTDVDLEELKGPGKKKGMISFIVNAENLRLYIDYKLVDHTQPVELTYGTHTLQVMASGYETWKRHLVVNSESATIVIELEEKDEDSKDTQEESECEKESENKKPTNSSGSCENNE